LGVTRLDEVIGKTDLDIFPPELANRYYGDEQALMESGQSLNREEMVVNPRTGEKRWLQTTKVPLRDKEGKVVGLMGINRDITDRKRAEEALASAHRLLEAMLDNIPDRIYFKDTQCRFVQCNRAVARRVGVEDPKQVIGKTDFDFYPPEKAEEFRKDDQRIMQSGEPLLNKTEQVIKPNGEMTWSSIAKVPLRDREGKIVGLVGISRDITDQKRAEEVLRQSRDELEKRVAERTAELSHERLLLRTLIDNLPDGIYAKDTAGRKTLANPADLKNLRCKTEAEAIGKSDFDFYPHDIAEKFQADDQSVIQGQPVINREEYFFDGEGQKRWLLTSKLPLHDQNGTIVGLVGIGRDITERKRAEEMLVRERLLLRTLIDNLPDGIYAKDTAGRKTLANPADLKVMGCKTEAEAVGKSDFDFFPKDIAEKFWADDQKVIEGQPVINREEYFFNEKGRKCWLLTSKLPLRDQDEKIFGLVGIGRDITDRKLTEAKLAHERDLLNTLMDNTPDLFYFKDLQSRFVRVSKSTLKYSFESALKRHRSSHQSPDAGELPPHLASLEEFKKYLIGKTDFDVLDEERARSTYNDEQEIIRTGQPIIGKLRRTTMPDGTVGWRITNKMPWRDKDGKIIGTFGTGRDITAIKEAEAKLEQSHKQLLEVSRQAGMAEVATSVLHNVGNVLNSVNVASSCVADSLRNSKAANLSKIVALLREHEADLGHFIANDPKGKQLPGYLAQLAGYLAGEQTDALDKLARLQKNIEHIREIVAMQQNYAKASGVLESLPIVDLVEDAVRMNVGSLERHNVKMLREYSETPLVLVDKHKVLQILVNLISNAKHACKDSEKPDKQITLRVANEKERIKISVIDNGVGIPAENMTRIFNYGFTTRKDGHGFGLHNGALAAKEMGGSLAAFSEGPGRGATFTLELPIQGQKANV